MILCIYTFVLGVLIARVMLDEKGRELSLGGVLVVLILIAMLVQPTP